MYDTDPTTYAANREYAQKLLSSATPAFAAGRATTVHLDGVITGAGTERGGDDVSLLRHYRCIRNAEHDEAVWFIASMESNSALDIPLNVATQLREQLSHGSQQSNHGVRADYLHARSEAAANLQSLITEMGIEKVRERLTTQLANSHLQTYSHMNSWF
jgi:hypothetical protein